VSRAVKSLPIGGTGSVAMIRRIDPRAFARLLPHGVDDPLRGVRRNGIALATVRACPGTVPRSRPACAGSIRWRDQLRAEHRAAGG
jgi:hypothetical protein